MSKDKEKPVINIDRDRLERAIEIWDQELIDPRRFEAVYNERKYGEKKGLFKTLFPGVKV